MGWSPALGKVAGVTVRMHLTFLLLVAWVAASRWSAGGPAAALDGAAFVLLVFLCVLLHEFGHVFAARLYGIRTADVTLLPIGGLARMERLPERPGAEILVALAGPAVNVVIAGVLLAGLGARFDLEDVAGIEAAQVSLTGRLAAVNVMLVAFNMIPAFPTDGGRVLRALLSLAVGRVRATRVAALAGQAFAVLFVMAGLLGSPLLALIGVFLFLAGGAESRDVAERAIARGLTARDGMVARFETLGEGATARDAARLLTATTQREFPVLGADGALRGWVLRDRLIRALAEDGPEAPVTGFATDAVPETRADAPLEGVIDAMAGAAVRLVTVRDAAGRFVGYVDGENLSEVLRVAEAGGRGAAAARA
jgi:Zn-dependent protease/CBS domain-containing protein